MARVQTLKQATYASSTHINDPLRRQNKSKKSDGKDSALKKSRGKAPAGPDSLREEILDLGGNEEDYELLKDVDNDEDVLATGNVKKDAALSKDLEKFMKGMNFSTLRPRDVEEEPDVEESEDDDGSSDATESVSGSESSEVTSEAAEETQKKEVKKSITIPKVGPSARLLVEPTPHWYTLLPPLPPSKAPPGSPSPQTLSQKQAHASSLHSSELTAYENATSANKLTSSSSDTAFLQKILTSGTLSDRLSALTLLAQSSPVHNMRALETLRGMANKKGREESLKALRAICDWWIGGGAPDRKLKYFIDQPLNHPGATDKHLLLWFFEDWLKKYFYTILQTLETLSLDPLPYVRLQAMGLIFTLLRDKPEQEQNLLRLLVNKLGDSERAVASRASYHLLQLLQTHPSMKSVIVREISSLVLKPSRGSSAATKTASGATHLKFTDTASKPTPKPKGKPQDRTDKRDLQQEHSRYYASITLNQVMLSTSDTDRAVAKQLISLYFELFKEILGTPTKQSDGNEKGDDTGSVVDHSRYAKEKRKKQEERKWKGKKKEDVEREGFAEVEDSNSKLISAILTGVNRALPFAKLSLEDVEFSKHIDTLFLISHKSTFNISLQSLRLMMQICHSLNSTPSPTSFSPSSSSALSVSITDRYYRTLYASLQDSRLDTSNKHAMYLNLLLKSLKMDTKLERVKAFVKRFVQLLVGAGNGGAEFVAGGLYLLGEIFKAKPALHDLFDKPRHAVRNEGESHEYDPKKRDPQYANAGSAPLWELTPLLSHYHPTIRLHTSQLLSGQDLTASADLSLNTLSHFLDRFVYKNPKKPRPRGPSAMQPGVAADVNDGTSIRMIRGAEMGDGDVINDERFWKKDVEDVPVDQVFFHKYFSKRNEKERARADKVARRKGEGEHEDVSANSEDEEEEEDASRKVDKVKSTREPDADAAEEEADENEEESEDEEEIWKAIQATHPDLNPDVDDSDDNPPSDDSDSNSGSDSELDDVGVQENGRGSDHEAQESKDDDANDDDDNDDDDDDALSLAESSSAEDLIALSDIELPNGLIPYHSSSSRSSSPSSPTPSDEEWSGFSSSSSSTQTPDPKGTKRKRRAKEKGREQGDKTEKRKRRKLRSLPTFATYEDYAKLIEGEPEDNI